MNKGWLIILVFLSISPSFGQKHAFYTLLKKSDSLFAIGKYDECLAERLKAISLAEKEENCIKMAYGYFQVGRAYYYLKHHPEAKSWLKNSLGKALSCGIDSLVFKNLRGLGALYLENRQPDSAFIFLMRAKDAYKPQIPPAEMATLLAILFELELRSQKNPQKARKTLDTARMYYAQLADSNQIAFYLIKEGIFFLETKDFKKAASYFDRAAGVYNRVGSAEGYMYALTCLASALEEAGDLNRSLKVLNQYTRIRDTIFQEQTAKNLAQYQARFETQKKEIENLALKSKNEQMQMAFGTGIMILILGGIGYFKYQKTLHRQRLEMQKQEEQRLRFAEVIMAQEQERTRIASDLHDGLGHLMAAIKLNSSALNLQEEANLKIHDRTLKIIDQASKEVRQISHRIMPQSLSELGIAESLREMASRINISGKIKVAVVEPIEEIQLSKDLEVSLYRMVQEILNNTLKHAQASEFEIRYQMENQTLNVLLKDNGIGFDPDQIGKSTGLGWKNIKSRVEMVDGTLEINSQPGVGTSVSIKIPLSPKIILPS